jgi:C-terminal processing protease CtpA/Prc
MSSAGQPSPLLEGTLPPMHRSRMLALLLVGVAAALFWGGFLLGHGIAFRELRAGAEERRYAIPFAEPLVDWPLAVLLDGGTASAAEMVAAAIRDYHRGVLVGQRTFGKGSVQGMYQLSDGSSVHVTISHWLSANGDPIEGVGLEPDILVAATAGSDAEDLSLRRALEYLDQEIGRVPSGAIAPLGLQDTGKVTV